MQRLRKYFDNQLYWNASFFVILCILYHASDNNILVFPNCHKDPWNKSIKKIIKNWLNANWNW